MGITSGSLYLAVSLAAGGQQVVAERDIPAEPQAAPARGYAIIDLPAFDRTKGKSLAAVISEEVQRTTAGAPDDPALQAAIATDSVNQAVLAEHDTRIALLKQRIESVRSQAGAGTTAVRELELRLTRALAARGLAMARTALADGDETPTQLASGEVAPAAPAPTGLVTQALPVEPTKPAHAKVRAYAAAPSSRIKAMAQPTNPLVARMRMTIRAALVRNPAILGPARNDRRRTLFANERLGIRPLHAEPLRAISGRHLTVRTASNASTRSRLYRARRLLSVARSALEPSTASRPHVALEIPGLWKFDGSTSWSLADYPRRAT